MERREELISLYQQRDIEHIRENAKLREELEEVKAQNELLKKAINGLIHDKKTCRYNRLLRENPCVVSLDYNLSDEIIISFERG